MTFKIETSAVLHTIVNFLSGIVEVLALLAVIMFSQFHRKDRNASTVIYFVITVAFLLPSFQLVESHGNGAPKSRCESMTPGHWVNAQTDRCPYQILVNTSVVSPGESVTITLKTTPGHVGFKGFFVMVKETVEDENGDEKPIENKNYGMFDITSSDMSQAQPVHCFEQRNSAMTHVINYVKDTVELHWTAPALLPQQGSKTFTKHGRQYMSKELKVIATFVKDFWTYWTDVEPVGGIKLILTDVSSQPSIPTTVSVSSHNPTIMADQKERSDIQPTTPTMVVVAGSAAPVETPVMNTDGSWSHFQRAWSFVTSLFGSSSASSSAARDNWD